MNESLRLWADPRLVYSVAIAAVTLLVAALWLFGRRNKRGRRAGMVCLVLSVLLHASLVVLVPMLPGFRGPAAVHPASAEEPGHAIVSFATFDPDVDLAEAARHQEAPALAPLPVAELMPPMDADEAAGQSQSVPEPAPSRVPDSLRISAGSDDTMVADLDAFVQAQPELPSPTMTAESALSPAEDDPPGPANVVVAQPEPRATPPAPESEPPAPDQTVRDQTVRDQTVRDQTVLGELPNEFAFRVGAAKQQALQTTGGDQSTEAAVAAALQFLASQQRPDGGWDPRSSGAGVERSPLGLSRGGAGARADTAITGLALLAMLGAGNTHNRGEYAEQVYRGLVYLIRVQKPDGSLAGNAAVYASTYSHGMAALAMCEAAAMTNDAAAVDAATRAIAHTRRMQHPTTGGWRYLQGDPGDLSQLGWQAMVIDAGDRAGIPIAPQLVSGTQRFLRSVRAGTQGGLASYRPGERATPTMTAEALATRLLLGDGVTAAEIAEAEALLMQHLPGHGTDNYYYWYYATLALHQLQDDAWRRWNHALKARLLSTQRSDGSWSSDTLWGGYGGTIYTTSMATLCLETYYRHATGPQRLRLVERMEAPPLRR